MIQIQSNMNNPLSNVNHSSETQIYNVRQSTLSRLFSLGFHRPIFLQLPWGKNLQIQKINNAYHTNFK